MMGDDSKSRFSEARKRVLLEMAESTGIGRLAEKTLHRILKLYIEPDESFHERSFVGKVADIINSDGIYEIQTRAAERLIPKLEKFLPLSRVCVVVPVICEKTVRWLNKETGELSSPRKSPKRESAYTAFRELYKIRKFLTHENLSVKLIFIKAEEYKYLDGWDKTGKRGATKIEKIPTSLVSEINICSPRDYLEFIPKGLSPEFSAKDLCRAVGFPAKITSYVIGLLLATHTIEFVRKEGRAHIYRAFKYIQ